ncbi:MAG: hypothetical protein WC545_02105 [Patescibacteria group bacterium]
MAYFNFYARFYAKRRAIAEAIATFWRFRPVRLYFFIFWPLHILTWLEAFFIRKNLSGNFLVLHYNVDFGVDLVSGPNRIFVYPLYGLAVFLINFSLGVFLTRRPDWRLFAHFLLAGLVLFSALLVLALMFIYLINFS